MSPLTFIRGVFHICVLLFSLAKGADKTLTEHVHRQKRLVRSEASLIQLASSTENLVDVMWKGSEEQRPTHREKNRKGHAMQVSPNDEPPMRVTAQYLSHLELKFSGMLDLFAKSLSDPFAYSSAVQKFGRVVSELLHVSGPSVSAEDLATLESKYGGYVSNVVRHVLSNREGNGGDSYHVHQGGDRFSRGTDSKRAHNYGQAYAEYLNKLFDSKTPLQQVAEVGILKGSGIAMWLELFPNSKVYGFDIDPSNFESNRAFLKKHGMNDAKLQIAKMDQTVDNTRWLTGQIGGTFSFVVDDGCHTEFCALMTIKSFMPNMAGQFVYIIEDGAGRGLLTKIKGLISGLKVEQRGDLTIVSRF